MVHVLITPCSKPVPNGVLCLPRADSFQDNVAMRHPDWLLTDCPVCGDGCYISPDHARTLNQFPNLRAACTLCALRG